ncbi:MAG: hypothetical protein PHD67_05965 [Oscillospiraceae bacterium]|nr:hypothetical protein [Oscillospiraceae bacterium]
MKLKTKLAAFVMAVSMMVSLCACGSETTWIADYNNVRLPAGLYNLYLTVAYSDALSKVSAETEIKDIYKADLEGTPLNEAVSNTAQQSIREHYAVLQMFDDMGLALNETELASVQAQVENMWGDGVAYKEHGIAKTSLTAYVEGIAKRSAIFNAIYGPGGEKEISESDLKAAFADTYYAVMYTSRSKVDSSGNALADDALATVNSAMDTLKKRADAGDDFFTVVLDDQKQQLTDNMQSTDSLADVTAANFTYVIEKESPYYSAEFLTALKEMSNDEIRIVNDSSRAYLMKKLDVTTLTEAYDARVSTLRNNLKGEEFNAMITESAASVTPVFNEKSLARYTAKSLKLGS